MIGDQLLTPGQHQAISELRGLQRLTGGGITVVGTREKDATGTVGVEVLVGCEVPDDWKPLVPLQSREPVTVLVPPGYPLRRPFVVTEHRRFAGLPHVIWGETICLHLSGNDWDPGRGMRGLAERLLDWFRRVADGTITAPDVVLDPPLTDLTHAEALLSVSPDLPPVLADDPRPWTAWAVVEAVGNARYEVREWLTDDDPSLDPGAYGGRAFLAPVLGLAEPVGFSYPQRLGDLLEGVEAQGVDAGLLGRLVVTAMRGSASMWAPDPEDEVRPLLFVVLVSPAPHRTSGEARTAYLAAWTVDVAGIAEGEVSDGDPVFWAPVFDRRPRHVTRRDVSRPAAWLQGKRVLLLGCGGLGAPIAEHCVRAGVAELHLVDDGIVRPGILVRQPYFDDEIGLPKALTLGVRLSLIDRNVEVTPLPENAVDLVMDGHDVPDVDLVIDATASRTVAAALERTRWERKQDHPPLLSVMVGHDSTHGVATLALPGANGAGADILRRFAIAAAGDERLHDVLDDFYPDLPRTELFIPEPGCSDPTYVGSAADLAAFSAGLLTEALTILGGQRDPAAPRRWATVLRSSGSASHRRHFSEPLTRLDDEHRYEVRLDSAAFTSVRREVLRMAGKRSPLVETGGLLLGQIDHASRVVWVTEARGLPDGSIASAEGLRLDLPAARAVVHERLTQSRRLVGFIGAWHTHPRHAAVPSPIDETAMEELTAAIGGPALMMIVGGRDRDRWRDWIGGRGRPDWYAALRFPT